jgi:hypothetical protein
MLLKYVGILKKGNFPVFPIFPGKNQFFPFPWVFSNFPGFFPTLSIEIQTISQIKRYFLQLKQFPN